MSDPKDLLELLVRSLVKDNAVLFPLPWRIDNDWTYEVVAANAKTVAKFWLGVDAQKVADVANEYGREARGALAIKSEDADDAVVKDRRTKT